MLRKNATITQSVQEEFIGDLLNKARSFIGRAEKALAESHLESSIICLRLGAAKLAEVMLYKEKEDKINFTYLWKKFKRVHCHITLKSSSQTCRDSTLQ